MSRNPLRYIAPPAPALTRALGTPLTRPQIAARIATLRAAIDALYAQAEVDGHGAVPGTGALKVTLSNYQNALWEMDRQASQPFAAAVTIPAAEQRLRQAGADLSETAQRMYAPTAKQVAFYQRLAESPVFTAEERSRAMAWLETHATRHLIKDQLDWLRGEVEMRRSPTATHARPTAT